MPVCLEWEAWTDLAAGFWRPLSPKWTGFPWTGLVGPAGRVIGSYLQA